MKLRALGPAIALSLLAGASASAQTYRLRADAYFGATGPSAGLVMLQGESRRPSWIDAEAALWMGTGEYPGDVLTASVRLRDPAGRGELRLGRILASAGAIRPVSIDGADATARAPWGTSVEAFGGGPAARAYASRDYDWAAGGRVGQRFGEGTAAGISYLQLRSGGAVAFEELGVDASAAPARWLDGAFSGAVDLARPGLADARLSIATRFSSLRLELFALRRSPSHLLPATSLFAALGDVPSQRAGGSFTWRPAPRLDVSGEGAVESLAGDPGAELKLRTLLRLDDRGDGSLGLEVHRQSAPLASWTGVRGTARIRLTGTLAASTELELAIPDDSHGRGASWPWGLVALGYRPEPRWELAGAIEAGASPTRIAAVSGIFRLSRAWSER